MLNPLHVFIIDDDEDDRELFCEVVSGISDSIKCRAALSGQEALHSLQNYHILPDFIFLDLNLPRLNGVQCLAELKKTEKLSSIPVIIYSTSRSEEDRKKTKELGCVYFLTKPSSMDKLRKELEFVFAKKYENDVLKSSDAR